MSSQRRRDKTISIRLTSAERNFIKTKAEERNTTVSNLIVMSIIDEETKAIKDVLPIVESVALLQERLKHLQGKIAPDELKDIMAKQSEIYDAICDIAKSIIYR